MLLLSRPFSNSEHEKGMLQEERIYRLIVRTSNPSLLNSAQSLPDMFILLCIEFKKIPRMSVGMTRNLMGRRWIQIRWTIFWTAPFIPRDLKVLFYGIIRDAIIVNHVIFMNVGMDLNPYHE